jgi:hypothetical protein
MNIVTYIGIILGVIIIAIWRRHQKFINKLKKVNSTRKPLSKDSYIKLLKDKGYDEQTITIVYDEIRKYIPFENFSMYPEDDIYELYEIDPEDFSDHITCILKKLNKAEPPQAEIDKLNWEYAQSMTIEYVLKLTKI